MHETWAPPFLRQVSPPLRFVLWVGVFLMVFGGAYAGLYPWLEDGVEAFCVVTAQVVEASIALSGVSTSIRGDIISLDGFSVRIIPECTGIFEMIIFAACVLAYPSSLRAKGIGLVLGFLSIYLFNLVRIAGLLVVGRYTPDYFDFFHVYFWQITLVGIIVVNWLLWLNVIVRRESIRSSS